jgi:hypothetical protein
MAYKLTDLIHTTKDTDITSNVTHMIGRSKTGQPMRTKAQARFQPIDQIMSRFDDIDAMFAAA